MFHNPENNKKDRERGEVMLEGMLVVLVTIAVLVWLMAMAFLYYQRYTTTIVTNDAAVKIASTYNNPTSDVVVGFVESSDLCSRDLYRMFIKPGDDSDLLEVNEDRARSYILYVLNKANFTGVVQDVQVDLKLVPDSHLRKHVSITATCTYKTPLGGIFKYVGISETNKYSVTANAECIDFAEYSSMIGFYKMLGNGGIIGDVKVVGSIIKAINSVVSVYNNFHS